MRRPWMSLALALATFADVVEIVKLGGWVGGSVASVVADTGWWYWWLGG